ncbi:hypothetical protein KKG24_05345 [Patescibacteria group bacterium]|nr:hypothetical protein [Patescibacteria group bacterium]MBU1778102.1 hypothetical protein [Patescibacteria group bacterium]
MSTMIMIMAGLGFAGLVALVWFGRNAVMNSLRPVITAIRATISRNKKLSAVIVVLLIMAIILIIRREDAGFWLYWLFTAVIIVGIIIAAIKIFVVGDYCKHVIMQLRLNNNWRLVALLVLAIHFSISAFLAGFGAPILTTEGKKATAPVRAYLEEDNLVSTNLNYFLFGEKKPLLDKKVVEEKKHYPSWMHIKFAILLWILFWIYFPIALREEVVEAINSAIEKVEKKIAWRKGGDVTTKATPATSATATTTVASTAGGKASDSFSTQLGIEIIVESLMELGKVLIRRAKR